MANFKTTKSNNLFKWWPVYALFIHGGYIQAWEGIKWFDSLCELTCVSPIFAACFSAIWKRQHNGNDSQLNSISFAWHWRVFSMPSFYAGKSLFLSRASIWCVLWWKPTITKDNLKSCWMNKPKRDMLSPFQWAGGTGGYSLRAADHFCESAFPRLKCP